MADYIIATSSTADLPRTWLEEKKIPFISYSYIGAGQVYEDDCREENRQKLYEEMRKGARFKTSMIGETQYYDFFRQFLDQDQDLIFLDMSRKMSVSYDNSIRAAERLRAEYPERRLYVMDTRCISGGLGLLVAEMARRREEGFSYSDVIDWGEENKLKIAHRFTVDDLNYLKEGGRVSNAAALVGSLLGIKPVLYVPDGGTLDVVQKARGRKSALKAVAASVLSDLQNMDVSDTVIHILHADCFTDAETVRSKIKAARPEISEIQISNLGVVIGAHCGPGLLTVFYICKGRNP